MSVAVWTLVYVLTASIWLWVLWGRNAHRWSGSGFLAFLLRDFWAPQYGPGTLRFFAALALLLETIFFVYGLRNPQVRDWGAVFDVFV